MKRLKIKDKIDLNILINKHDYVIDKGHVFKDNNGEIRYFGGE